MGISYPAILIESKERIYRCKTTKPLHGIPKPNYDVEYSFTIKYRDSDLEEKRLQLKMASIVAPEYVLSNPYCTVYIHDGMAVVSDFMLRDNVKCVG